MVLTFFRTSYLKGGKAGYLHTASGDTPALEYRRLCSPISKLVTSRFFRKWCSSGVVSAFSLRETLDFTGFSGIFKDTAVAYKQNFFHPKSSPGLTGTATPAGALPAGLFLIYKHRPCPKKVGSAAEAWRPRLQGSSRSKRDFLRGSGDCLHCVPATPRRNCLGV